MVKKLLYVIVNCLSNCILLLLGHEFIVIAFSLSIINIILIPILFRKESSLLMAILTIILMLSFSTIQILDGYYNGDDGTFLAMFFFTIILTIIPMIISAIVHFVIYICKMCIKKFNSRKLSPTHTQST